MARRSSPPSRANSDSTAASACSTSAPGRACSRSASRLTAARWSASIRSRRWSRPPGRRASRAGVAVEFIDGRFEDLAAGLGAFDVVTIGRAIHWLDPGPARTALDRVVKPLGRILVCHASSVDDGRNPWLGAFKAIRNRWRDDRPKRDRDVFFAGGPFVPRGTISVETAATFPVERLADRILSMSTSSPERLGDNVPAMRSAMREALASFATEGEILDIVEAQAEVFERAGKQ